MRRFTRLCAGRWPVAFLAAMLLFVPSAFAAGVTGDGWRPAGAAVPNVIDASSGFCLNYGIVSGSVIGPGSTAGEFGTPVAGEKFTFTATGVGVGTWRIVGDPGGVTTLASGGVFPGTLTYTVPASPLPTGVGFFVDTYAGNGDTISGVCQSNPIDIPTLSRWSLLALVLLLGSFGFVAFRLRRQG